jgi:hypothetical protein
MYVTQQLLPNLVNFWQQSVLPAFAERDRIGSGGVYVGWIPHPPPPPHSTSPFFSSSLDGNANNTNNQNHNNNHSIVVVNNNQSLWRKRTADVAGFLPDHNASPTKMTIT